MARKTLKRNIHDYTRQIHSTRRTGTEPVENWNEKEAKEENKVSCRHCRYFYSSCSEFIGKYHKPCKDFEWD